MAGPRWRVAQKMNSMPKHVVTSTIGPLEWNASALKGDPTAAITELKQGEGGPILVAGSAMLVRTLLARDLVDELRLMVFPVMIGGGVTVFPQQRDMISLELSELTRYSSGVLLQMYRPSPAGYRQG